MKNVDELESGYKKHLRKTLELLEQKRKRILIRTIYVILSFLLPFMVPISVLIKETIADYLLAISLANVFIAFVVLLFGINSRKNYRKLYKKEIIGKIVKHINPDWNYASDMKVYMINFLKSEMFPERYDWFDGDDFIWGKMDGSDFQFSEFHVKGKASTYNQKGLNSEKWLPIFNGLFMHAELKTSFKGKTFISPVSAETVFGKDTTENKGRYKLVNLEENAFEDRFIVHSNDVTEAKHILNNIILQSILAFQNQYYNNPIKLSIIGSRVYFAIHSNKKLFEPKIWRSGVNFEDIGFMHHLFQLTTLIITELNLNSRIWTKA